METGGHGIRIWWSRVGNPRMGFDGTGIRANPNVEFGCIECDYLMWVRNPNLVVQGGESGIGIRWDWNPGGFKCEIWVYRIVFINPDMGPESG
jgi:hypothetical protein